MLNNVKHLALYYARFFAMLRMTLPSLDSFTTNYFKQL